MSSLARPRADLDALLRPGTYGPVSRSDMGTQDGVAEERKIRPAMKQRIVRRKAKR